MQKIGLGLLAGFLSAVPAQAADQVLFGPLPSWVEPHSPQDVSELGESTLPVQIVLLDTQSRMEQGTQTTYSAIALHFNAPQGLAAGSVALPWDPETDDLTVHAVVIRRGDETIDVLASGQTFTTLRREQNLEQAMLDGVLTANLIPEGLQVGDVLDVRYSVVSRNPTLKAQNNAFFGPFNFPAKQVHLRLQWPTSNRMQVVKGADLPDWVRSRKDGFDTVELTLRDVEPVALPAGAPSRYQLVRFAEASDFSSWDEVSALFAPLYENAAKLPATGSLRDEVERIRTATTDPVERTEAALKLVQSRIRYVALSMGQGGLEPADAALTWSRRFGDCKGKTALLLALLGELGIKAQPVLVNSAIGDGLSGRLPSAHAFDHVLVLAEIDGKQHWLDGTRSGDTKLANLTIPHFSWGLPVRSAGAELIPVMPTQLDQPSEDIAIHMDATNGLEAPVPTKIELTLRGDNAISMQQVMANFSGEARDRTLREYWRNRFDFVEADQVGIQYNEEAAEFHISLSGSAKMDWDDGWYETDETGVGYQADFKRESGPNDDAPFAVPYPYFERATQTILLPPSFTKDAVRGDVDVNESVAGIEYNRHARLTGNTFFIERSERSIAPEFTSKEAPAAQKRLRELRDQRVHLRVPDNYRATDAELALALEKPLTTASEFMVRGNDLLDAGKYAEAQADFVQAAKLEPSNEWAWANSGMALAWSGEFDDALAAFAKAEAINPRNYVVAHGRGLAAERRYQYETAIAEYTKAIELNPNEFAYGHRAGSYLAVQKSDLALADAAKALELAPGYLEMYALRSHILGEMGRDAEAEAEVDALAKNTSDSNWALGMASQLYTELGLKEKAQMLIDRALEEDPSSMSYLARSRLREPTDIEGQLADLDEAIRLSPDYEDAISAKANLLYAERRLDEAMAIINQALEKYPEMQSLYLVKANILRVQGKREEVLEQASAIQAANRDAPHAYIIASKILDAYGKRAEALEAIDRALAINIEPYMYLNRAQVREKVDFEGRLGDVNEALRLQPAMQDALYVKAEILTDQDDFAGALAVYDELLAKTPEEGALLNYRSVALWKLGRIDDAQDGFAKAKLLSTTAPELNNLCYVKAMADVALEIALAECE
ncbi:MAG: DUF3857 domain-containing protein, partial [Alphaproteobacteria bacterium]